MVGQRLAARRPSASPGAARARPGRRRTPTTPSPRRAPVPPAGSPRARRAGRGRPRRRGRRPRTACRRRARESRTRRGGSCAGGRPPSPRSRSRRGVRRVRAPRCAAAAAPPTPRRDRAAAGRRPRRSPASRKQSALSRRTASPPLVAMAALLAAAHEHRRSSRRCRGAVPGRDGAVESVEALSITVTSAPGWASAAGSECSSRWPWSAEISRICVHPSRPTRRRCRAGAPAGRAPRPPRPGSACRGPGPSRPGAAPASGKATAAPASRAISCPAAQSTERVAPRHHDGVEASSRPRNRARARSSPRTAGGPLRWRRAPRRSAPRGPAWRSRGPAAPARPWRSAAAGCAVAAGRPRRSGPTTPRRWPGRTRSPRVTLAHPAARRRSRSRGRSRASRAWRCASRPPGPPPRAPGLRRESSTSPRSSEISGERNVEGLELREHGVLRLAVDHERHVAPHAPAGGHGPVGGQRVALEGVARPGGGPAAHAQPVGASAGPRAASSPGGYGGRGTRTRSQQLPVHRGRLVGGALPAQLRRAAAAELGHPRPSLRDRRARLRWWRRCRPRRWGRSTRPPRPPASGRAVASEAATGMPRAIASTTASPKPS